MITSIGSHIKDIVAKLDTISVLTALLPGGIWFEKPEEKSSTYMYITLVTDNITSNSNKGSLLKVARLSCHIIGGTQDVLPNALYSIVDTITNQIVDEQCTKISITGLKITSIGEGNISPMFTIEKNKPYIVKDYFFTYYSI